MTVNIGGYWADKNKGKCVCKDYDLIWGNKVSCEFRKKVIEIAQRLNKDPNLLMAAMALETGRTFSPTAGKGSSYVGLIQFGDDAAESVGTTRDALLKMTALQQLDYVEKYLTKNKSKLTTLADFYLSILMPVDIGKGSTPNHIVFDNQYHLEYKKDGKTLTDLSKSRHYGYRQNPVFFYEVGEKEKVKKGGEKYDGEGKTYIWEIEKYVSAIYDEGKGQKTKNLSCNKDDVVKPDVESGTWNVIITEKYTGKKCEHEKPRNNCRRGKIEVFDHNEKIAFTISDCLLEGVAGEDRLITNSDTPYGTYKISASPFIIGSSSGGKRVSYGPNPRLSFEPIKDSEDEADKSGRSAIRIHGGRQEDKITFKPIPDPILKRTHGCIRIFDSDAKSFYEWWVDFYKNNPNIKPGKLKIIKS
ncbi:L,D-transpeptidase [Flavobacterium anhuiense]|uniref:L,D-transpeptidase n=1 Tax=Flavobacterium anhuiense TaxID=459526 RepID=UPI000E6BEAF0|nr:L,D-transpeptidase [Flavobacterium anhuiense]